MHKVAKHFQVLIGREGVVGCQDGGGHLARPEQGRWTGRLGGISTGNTLPIALIANRFLFIAL